VFPLKILLVSAAIIGIALSRVRSHHRFASFGPANVATTIRAVLTAIVCGCIGEAHTSAVAVVAIAAGSAATLLDGVDGWLARRTNMVSAFGARFDTEVDALLILALSILAWRYGKAGVWVLTSGLLRYLWLAAGWALPWLNGPLTPTLRGRAVCVAQVVILLIVLLPTVPPSASAPIAAAGVLALVYSFAVDTLWLWQRR
jgi:phosphatidylglycerophosphate synthase